MPEEGQGRKVLWEKASGCDNILLSDARGGPKKKSFMEKSIGIQQYLAFRCLKRAKEEKSHGKKHRDSIISCIPMPEEGQRRKVSWEKASGFNNILLSDA
jgi:hypothetical protein